MKMNYRDIVNAIDKTNKLKEKVSKQIEELNNEIAQKKVSLEQSITNADAETFSRISQDIEFIKSRIHSLDDSLASIGTGVTNGEILEVYNTEQQSYANSIDKDIDALYKEKKKFFEMYYNILVKQNEFLQKKEHLESVGMQNDSFFSLSYTSPVPTFKDKCAFQLFYDELVDKGYEWEIIKILLGGVTHIDMK